MDAVNDPSIHTVVVMSAAQVGKTEIINNVLGYYVDQDPSPILVIQPTLDMADAWSKDRFAPMVRDTPVLAAKVADTKARDSGNTIRHKVFPGGHITMAGANAPAGLASRPIRIVAFDEVDRYPVSAGTEGDPVSLGRKRTATFWNRKIVMTSTPTVKGASRIETAYENSDERRYWVPCPHCGDHQTLKWAQVKWPKGEPAAAYYVCEHCGAEITDADKPSMLAEGEWRAEKKGHGIAGFHINELYSPWSSFGEIALAFEVARPLPETLRTWVNTALGETWEEEGEQVDDASLYERRENYGPAVPADGLILTAGVDVQGDRLEVGIDAWGWGEECWNMDYRVLWGDPTQPQVWEELDRLLSMGLPHVAGHHLDISAVCIDSGYETDMVYAFCHPRLGRRIFAAKGMEGAGRPIASAPRRISLKNGKTLRLVIVGVDEAKRIVMSRLQVTEGPGRCHFPLSRDEEYFAQLTAEKKQTKFRHGHPYHIWVKTRPRNEALDIRILSMAALRLVNPRWDELADRNDRAAMAANHTPVPAPATNIPVPPSLRRRGLCQ